MSDVLGGKETFLIWIVNSKINVELIKYRYSEVGTTLGRPLTVKTHYYFWNINQTIKILP